MVVTLREGNRVKYILRRWDQDELRDELLKHFKKLCPECHEYSFKKTVEGVLIYFSNVLDEGIDRTKNQLVQKKAI